MESTNQEIDLQDLAVRAVLFFKKNIRFVMIITLACVLVSIVFYILLPKVYQSRMIILSDILTESYSKEITESLENLIKENNYDALASRLKLSEHEAESIKSVEIVSVKKDKTTQSDKEPDNTIFIVTANIRAKEILPKLQSGIIEYLRENEFVKIRVRQRRDMYQSLIGKIGLEINSLDSLKRRLFTGQPVYAKSSEMLLVDPTSIYSKIIELNKEQIELKNALELADSIQLVEGFTVFQQPKQPKLSVLVVMGLFVGFLSAVGFLAASKLFKLANRASV